MTHERHVAKEVRDEYVETMSKIYYSYFKSYLNRLMKLQVSYIQSYPNLLLDFEKWSEPVCDAGAQSLLLSAY